MTEQATRHTLTLAICARNAQDIIGNCLESIRNQTVPPDELIVALDSLDDPTADVTRRYGARVIVSSATGLYEARNAVLDACTTDYLAFTDADCELVPDWVALVHKVFDERPHAAAGTGRHPPIGKRNLAGWHHHMWYLVETRSTGETEGVIGGNSYFRTSALREVGGWLRLPRHSAAEDVYISKALRSAGYTIWFEEGAAAQHRYETRLRGLWKKSVMMGKDIVVMHRAAGWFDGLWWYTMAIPLILSVFIVGVLLAFVQPMAGLLLVALPLVATLVYLTLRFKSLGAAFPRWLARWVLIWPYSWGILQGLVAPIPAEARLAKPATE